MIISASRIVAKEQIASGVLGAKSMLLAASESAINEAIGTIIRAGKQPAEGEFKIKVLWRSDDHAE